MAEKDTEETRKAVFQLGDHIASSIEGKGDKPEIVNILPSKGLIEQSVQYFHKPVSLNMYYYLANSNILDLNEKTDVILARYERDNQKIRVLSIRYPTSLDAQRIYVRFGKIYFSDKPRSESSFRIEEIEGDEFVGAMHVDRFIVLVFEGNDCHTISKLYKDIQNRIQEGWGR